MVEESQAETRAERGVPMVGPTAEQIFKLSKYQFMDYLRSRRFIILTGIVVIIGLILTVVVAHFRGLIISTNLAFYGSFWGGGSDIVIVLAAVFFGGDAIAGEFQNKTGYFLMGLPIRRQTVYVGKFIAAFVASVAMLAVFLVILILNGAYYFGGGLLPWQLGLSFILAVLYLLAVLGTTFLFSSLFKVAAYGFVLTAILFLFGFTLIQDLITGLVKLNNPWMVISYAESAIGNVFTPSTPTCQINWGLSNGVCTTVTTFGKFSMVSVSYPAGIAESVLIMLGYFVVTAIVGSWLFQREEFT